MKYWVIIQARYSSNRLPVKILTDIRYKREKRFSTCSRSNATKSAN